MTDARSQILDMVEERDGEWIVKDISGGAKARYVRVYFASAYRFEDVTLTVMAVLMLPLVLAEGMHTAAVYGTDVEIVARILAAAKTPAPDARQTQQNEPGQATEGGRRVKVPPPKPTQPPRGGRALTADRKVR
jgi:hypothetical protein